MAIPFDGTFSWGLRQRSSKLFQLPTTLNPAIYDSTPIATMRSTRSSASCKKRLSRKTYILVASSSQTTYYQYYYYSFSYKPCAWHLKNIITLRLALRHFGKSSNDGTIVYGSGYLRPNELLHIHHVGEGRGARGEEECVLLRPFQYGLHMGQNE